jgi:DGQHR domain-containing protein
MTKNKGEKRLAGEVRIFTYDALRFRQRGSGAPTLVMFSAPVKDIAGWATVDQLGPRSRGPQREQKEAKTKAVARFLSDDERNTIPTAVILAFEKGKARFRGAASGERKAGAGKLEIRVGANPVASIVDGQHRIYGIADFNASMNVAVVALLDADEMEKAFQFLVINNKSSRIAASHTKALLAKLKDTGLAERLRGARIAFDAEGVNDVALVNGAKDSPFYQTIDWTTTPASKRMIPATAIEASLEYLGGIGISEFEDRDVRRSVFLAMWSAIRAEWSALWVPGSRLVSKVAIICLTRFIIDRITNWADSDQLEVDVADLEQVESLTKKIVRFIDRKFWTARWAEKAQGGFDTAQGRERVLAAITQVYRNGRKDLPWHSDIEILEVAGAADE